MNITIRGPFCKPTAINVAFGFSIEKERYSNEKIVLRIGLLFWLIQIEGKTK